MFDTRKSVQASLGRLFDLGQLSNSKRHENEAIIRGLCRNAYLGPDLSLCRVLGRYKMFVDTNDVGLSSHMLLDGFWEMWVTEAMLGHVRLGMKVLDIGANLGYFTLLMSELVGPEGSVHAFEPNGLIAARLRKSIAVNGFGNRTSVHQFALGDHEGEVALFVPEHEPKNATVIPLADASSPSIPMRRLDSFDTLLDADFIKIDVEGAEEGLWRGMERLLKRQRSLMIYLEFTPGRYADPGAFLDEILSHGFALAVVDFKRGVIPVSRADVLGAPPLEDQMLVLAR